MLVFILLFVVFELMIVYKIDAQNKKGSTALHYLVTHRFNNLVVWLVRQGADITIEDVRGFTPYDMALPWLQKEMKGNLIKTHCKVLKY